MAIKYIDGIMLSCNFCEELYEYDIDCIYKKGEENKMKKDAEKDGWVFYPGGICKCESCIYEEEQGQLEENKK